jgi:hypothetical protein
MLRYHPPTDKQYYRKEFLFQKMMTNILTKSEVNEFKNLYSFLVNQSYKDNEPLGQAFAGMMLAAVMNYNAEHFNLLDPEWWYWSILNWGLA